jgi:nitroreductase
MEFQDVVRKRKMVRSFQDRPIDAAVVERIIANAQRAPSAGFSQGWGFLILDGKDETRRYWDALWPADARAGWSWPDLFNAPLLVVCLSNKMAYLRRYAEADKGWTDMDERRWPVPYWDIDTGMAALLMLLTAVDAGLGAVFFGVRDQAKLRETFGVPAEYTAIGVIAFGHPRSADRPSPSLRRGHRSAEDVVRRGRWS